MLIVVSALFFVGWKAGDKADIEWNNVWYRGNIKSVDAQNTGAFCVHYEGWADSYDECAITPARLAPLGSKAAAKTGPSATTSGSGGASGGNFEFDYCGGKSKASCPSDKECAWNGSKCVKK
jgi:hypothetical protein